MLTVIDDLSSQRNRFLAFVQRRVHDRATAEDILQASYARAISRAEALKAEDSAEAWFFRILRNAVIDHYRHHAVEARSFASLTPETEPPSFVPDPAPATICGCVHDVLEQLPASYSEILRKVDLEEAPLDSFAQRSGITSGNAAVRAHRARRALRKQLSHHCGACAQGSCLDCNCRHNSPQRHQSPTS
jgi:RNA polymerase sigma-70 factor (ECF subfamily)